MKIEVIKYKLQCDNCGTQIADKYYESAPEYDEYNYDGWYTDEQPNGDRHYCPECWLFSPEEKYDDVVLIKTAQGYKKL